MGTYIWSCWGIRPANLDLILISRSWHIPIIATAAAVREKEIIEAVVFIDIWAFNDNSRGLVCKIDRVAGRSGSVSAQPHLEETAPIRAK